MTRLLLAAVLAATLHGGEWVPMTVIATAYDPMCSHCCGCRYTGITADGTKTSEVPYGIAVDPRVIPYGTAIYIPPGYGYLDNQCRTESSRVFFADDTGSAIIRETRNGTMPRIDLRFRHHSNAKRFGRKTMLVYRWQE